MKKIVLLLVVTIFTLFNMSIAEASCNNCRDGYCDEEGYCDWCEDGYEQDDGNCYGYPDNCDSINIDNGIVSCDECVLGYGLVDGICKKCQASNCDWCNGDNNQCEECKDGYGFDRNGNCSPCEDKNCQYCWRSGNEKCSRCKDGYTMSDNGNCEPIQIEHCKDTSEYGRNLCVECETGYMLADGKCVTQCPSGYTEGYITLSTKYCKNPKCQGYGGGYNNEFYIWYCGACKNSYLLNGECVDECGDGYNIISQGFYGNRCEPANCNKWDKNNCHECNDGYFIQDGKCVESCQNGYIIGTNDYGATTCFPAELGCGYGEKQIGNECVAREDGEGCGVGFYLKDNLCVSESKGCGAGYLGKDGVCISSANGCGVGYKDMGGWCNRIQYTPAEAAPLLNDDNNFVILTFKK